MPLPAKMSRLTPLAALCLSSMLTALPSWASNLPAECERAAASASQRHDVPLDVLLAIAHVESGRKTQGQLRPWPWALHAMGQGQWFATAEAALERARAVIASGTRNVDLGCFQINYHWHGHAFASLDAMIGPRSNADYAARLLRGHFNRLGSWERAAARYHSATPDLADRYLARFQSARARIDLHTMPPDSLMAQTSTPENQAIARAANSFVLLLPAASGQLGSLVPQGTMSRRGAPALIDFSREPRP